MIDFIRKKADKAHQTYYAFKELSKDSTLSSDLNLTGLKVDINILPIEVDDSGHFFVLTGNKNKPFGIFDPNNKHDFVLLHNEKGGVLVETSDLKTVIMKNRDVIEKGIDKTYSIMGVKMNLGILAKSINSPSFLELLTVLHEDGS